MILVGIPFFILSLFDLGKSLRNNKSTSSGKKLLGMVFGILQALLGLLFMVIGMAVIGWTLFVEIKDYSGDLIFGIWLWLGLAVFGFYWLRAPFKKRIESNKEAIQEESVQYASVWRRFGAYWIDFLIMIPVIYILFIFL